ncbi:MAG: hypothetical protein JWN88_2950, partial [Frankiales bacterium]|nr:hypothetical protein [Frankiales bacterium]
MDPLTRLRPERRRSAERFAGLLDRRSRPPAQETPPQPGPSEPLADLVRLTERLAQAGRADEPAAVPSPGFRVALRTRLLAVAAVQGTGSPEPVSAAPGTPAGATSWRTSRRGQRTLGVVAGSLASVIAVSGVAAAGAQSLPGDPFYGVKRTVETLQLAAARGDLAKGQRHLQLAGNRLDEVQELFDERGVAVEELVDGRLSRGFDDLDREVREGSELLTSAFRRAQGKGRTAEEQAPLRALSGFSAATGAGLQLLVDELPPTGRARAVASLALVTSVGAEAQELLRLGTCGPSCQAAATTTGEQPAGPCNCPTGSDPEATPLDGAPGGTAPAGPPAVDAGAPWHAPAAPGAGGPVSEDPGAAVPGGPGTPSTS